jgi:CDP-diacylglycerol--serine O-phosphatidyltransferase
MVSEFRYFSFKEFKLHRRHPFPVLLVLIGLIALTIGAPELTLFLGITGYALSAPVAALWRVVRGRRGATTVPAATGDTALRPAVRPAAGYDARGTTTE